MVRFREEESTEWLQGVVEVAGHWVEMDRDRGLGGVVWWLE